jgi:hypothetical protein
MWCGYRLLDSTFAWLNCNLANLFGPIKHGTLAVSRSAAPGSTNGGGPFAPGASGEANPQVQIQFPRPKRQNTPATTLLTMANMIPGPFMAASPIT